MMPSYFRRAILTQIQFHPIMSVQQGKGFYITLSSSNEQDAMSQFRPI